jgi:hypothetical protein
MDSNNNMVNLKDFYQMLKQHDWYYEYSDDYGVYMRGKANRNKLKKMAAQSPAHQHLFDSFFRHYFSGEPFSTEKTPLPEEPKSD